MFRKLGSTGPTKRVTIIVDGIALQAEEGETIAAVLLRQPSGIARTTALSGTGRAPFCMMGACFECVVEIDGGPSIRSCLATARAGISVRRQSGRPALMSMVTA